MSKFLVKLSFFLALCILLIFLINLHQVKIDNPSDYLAAMIDKHERAKKIETPKIIFAGGSHLAFGLDSEMIEKEFSVPVVNLGLNSGLGLSFMLEEVKYLMKDNDIVLISFAYLQTNDGILELNKIASDYYTEAKNFYNFTMYKKLKYYLANTRKKYIDLIDGLPKIFISRKKNQNKDNDVIYSRSAFNQYGDVVAHLDLKPRKELLDKEVFNYEYWEGIKIMNRFGDYAQKRNVKVYYFYGNLASSEYAKNKRVIELLASDINQDVNIEKLNKASDFVFNDNLFFDTVYHLNKDGRAIHTKKIIEMMKNNQNLFNHLINIQHKYYQQCCEKFKS